MFVTSSCFVCPFLCLVIVLYRPYCHGAHKPDLTYFVCNKFQNAVPEIFKTLFPEFSNRALWNFQIALYGILKSRFMEYSNLRLASKRSCSICARKIGINL